MLVQLCGQRGRDRGDGGRWCSELGVQLLQLSLRRKFEQRGTWRKHNDMVAIYPPVMKLDNFKIDDSDGECIANNTAFDRIPLSATMVALGTPCWTVEYGQ
ncbi:hypothetical protein [Nocardia alba]|uniref:hypothetical protein n=1 Tax=Nocardia alba TaxID=225051 RepID=UPI001FB226C6|nr:hypothetical protein [Nocardia alba]